jgi:transposase
MKGCPSNRKVTPEIERALVSQKLLKEWCHYSLNQRAMMLEKMFGVKIGGDVIRQYYKKNGINYIKP